MNAKTLQTLFQIVLLEPKESLNIGSVARAMMNYGFTNLALVNPKNFDLERASTTARKAKVLFEPAKIFDSIEKALADSTFVVGFTIKDSKNTPPVFFLEDWVQTIPDLLKASNSKITLLFGPEDTGLCYKDLPACNAIIRIPSDQNYDSLNLAQAVLLALYSIAKNNFIYDTEKSSEPAATSEQYFALENLILDSAQKSEFINEGTPENTILLLKNIFRRPNLSQREMQILLGLFSRISKTIVT